MPVKNHLNIFEYVDYRFFLTDYIGRQKRGGRPFTHRSFAKKAGLSVGLLNDILSKRQNLTLAAMHKYARAMDLNSKEIAYFEALVGFNNADTNAEKNRFFGEMVRLRGRSPVKFLDSRQYEYFSAWYNPVVREMMVHLGLGDNAEAISREINPPVSPSKIRKSIALLKELGLVYQSPDGVWHASDKVISSEYEIQSVALKNYHIGMLERAAESLDYYTSSEREFQGLTIAASKATMQRMKERIRSFTDELLCMAAAETEKTEEVFQINIQAFPFTRKGRT
ncbi:MAG: TIGR02147 family protein, partial [Fibrobacter sp.]|nr:TIGR02147 family protein [Fibrobacter sp.]